MTCIRDRTYEESRVVALVVMLYTCIRMLLLLIYVELRVIY